MPQVDFIGKNKIEKWFSKDKFKDIHIIIQRNLSWKEAAQNLIQMANNKTIEFQALSNR
jgi:dTDP-D-glucose 4,6-dehydratase